MCTPPTRMMTMMMMRGLLLLALLFGVRAEGEVDSTKAKMAAVEAEVSAIYKKYNPEKLEKIKTIMFRYKGREADLLKDLRDKYKVSTENMSVKLWLEQHGDENTSEAVLVDALSSIDFSNAFHPETAQQTGYKLHMRIPGEVVYGVGLSQYEGTVWKHIDKVADQGFGEPVMVLDGRAREHKTRGEYYGKARRYRHLQFRGSQPTPYNCLRRTTWRDAPNDDLGHEPISSDDLLLAFIDRGWLYDDVLIITKDWLIYEQSFEDEAWAVPLRDIADVVVMPCHRDDDCLSFMLDVPRGVPGNFSAKTDVCSEHHPREWANNETWRDFIRVRIGAKCPAGSFFQDVQRTNPVIQLILKLSERARLRTQLRQVSQTSSVDLPPMEGTPVVVLPMSARIMAVIDTGAAQFLLASLLFGGLAMLVRSHIFAQWTVVAGPPSTIAEKRVDPTTKSQTKVVPKEEDASKSKGKTRAQFRSPSPTPSNPTQRHPKHANANVHIVNYILTVYMDRYPLLRNRVYSVNQIEPKDDNRAWKLCALVFVCLNFATWLLWFHSVASTHGWDGKQEQEQSWLSWTNQAQVSNVLPLRSNVFPHAGVGLKAELARFFFIMLGRGAMLFSLRKSLYHYCGQPISVAALFSIACLFYMAPLISVGLVVEGCVVYVNFPTLKDESIRITNVAKLIFGLCVGCYAYATVYIIPYAHSCGCLDTGASVLSGFAGAVNSLGGDVATGTCGWRSAPCLLACGLLRKVIRSTAFALCLTNLQSTLQSGIPAELVNFIGLVFPTGQFGWWYFSALLSVHVFVFGVLPVVATHCIARWIWHEVIEKRTKIE